MRDRMSVLKSVFFAWGALTSFIFCGSTIAVHVEEVPYNVRELVVGPWGPELQALFIAGVVIFVLAGPVAIAAVICEARMKAAVLFPFLLAVYLIFASAFFLAVFPMESIHDIVGSPVLGWPSNLELFLRLSGLLLTPAVVLTGAALSECYRVRGGVRENAAGAVLWFCWAGLLLPLAYWGVVSQAATDNLVELMARGADVWAGLATATWFGVWGCTGTFFAGGWPAALLNPKWRTFLLVLVILGTSVAVGYLMINLATAREIHKYGSTFSALQFLLSPDREHLIDGVGLMARYAGVHIGLVCLTALSQRPVIVWFKENRG